MFTLNADEQAFWDIAIKAAALIATLGGGYIAVFKYLFERRQANQTAKLQSHAPFSQKRQEVYFELVETTALLGNRSPTTPEWQDAALRFWELYWGAIPMVVDRHVARLVDEFSEILAPEADGVMLRNKSMELARECRKALGEAWNVALEDLPRTRVT